MPTPRRTPRKLKFDVIAETPAVISMQSKTCVLAERARERWVPVLISRTSRPRSGLVEAVFPDSSRSKINISETKALSIQKGDELRLNDDPHTYKVVLTMKSDDDAQFRLENGDDMVELVPRRGGRTIKSPVKNIFFHSAESFEPFGLKVPSSSVTPKRKMIDRPKPAQTKKSVLQTGSPLPVTRRIQSIIYNPPATPVAEAIFAGCIFVVVDDLVGETANILTSHGAQTVRVLSDLLDTSDLQKGVSYTGPSSATFFAVIGNALTPTMPFLETLSIGWPCLNTAFVQECISQNKFICWQDYLLGIVSPEGYIKSQSCFEFKQQWDMNFTLERQFEHRSAVLASTCVPLYVSSNFPTEVLVLAALAFQKFNLLEADSEIPHGTIFIDTVLHDPESYVIENMRRMSRQSRLESTVLTNAQWLIRCILDQKVV